MDMATFHSIWTVLLLVLFLGIWVWAWSKQRKGAFDAAARLPLDDENEDLNLPTHRGEKNHG